MQVFVWCCRYNSKRYAKAASSMARIRIWEFYYLNNKYEQRAQTCMDKERNSVGCSGLLISFCFIKLNLLKFSGKTGFRNIIFLVVLRKSQTEFSSYFPNWSLISCKRFCPFTRLVLFLSIHHLEFAKRMAS